MIAPTIRVKWTRLNTAKILQEIRAVELTTLAQLKGPIKEVIDRNIGTQYFSLNDLANLGHPYKLGGSGRPGGIPAGVVNKQSGDFHRSLILRGPRATQDRITITVYSRGNKILGDWLLTGTGRMKGRPWTKHLRTEIYQVVMPVINTVNRRLRLRVKV